MKRNQKIGKKEKMIKKSSQKMEKIRGRKGERKKSV